MLVGCCRPMATLNPVVRIRCTQPGCRFHVVATTEPTAIAALAIHLEYADASRAPHGHQ